MRSLCGRIAGMAALALVACHPPPRTAPDPAPVVPPPDPPAPVVQAPPTPASRCEDCGPGEFCLSVLHGEAPGPGHPGVSISCEALPTACRTDVTCDCLHSHPTSLGVGMGGCGVLPGGMLQLRIAMP